MKSKIDAIDNVSRCVFVSKDDAFNEYKSEFEDGDELSTASRKIRSAIPSGSF